MNRRDFLKIVGITAATSTAALYGCGSKEGSSEGSKVLGPIPTDKMTYRSFPGLGSDKVSILGYGCMRWPTVPAPDGKGEMIDQDAVNELVDYAIAHGVNYFDTSPMRDIGRRENTIVPVGTVESCRHQSDSKFGVTGIMRPAYNAEIKFLVFLFFVGIVEVIQNFSEKTAFLGKRVYRIRRN